jgi:triacylglycerol esterase/lipase EstA (alpha/beta hydrolase family)
MKGPGQLARLQQFITLSALLLAAGWAAMFLRQQRPVLAAAGASLIVGGYALILAFEMALVRFTHRDDPTPRASLRALVRAWWAEVLSAPVVFCWRQPFRSQAWPDQLHATAQSRRGVLFVHGFVCNRGLWNPWLRELTAQGTPFIAVNLEPVFGSIDASMPTIESAVQRLQAATGLAPVVVAHSMGGLVLRRWWAEHDGAARIHHAITIGTPHQGTWLARWGHTVNARQMRMTSPWLGSLTQREVSEIAKGTRRFTCFYSHCDNIVFPPRLAMLQGACNRHLPGYAHVHMADAPQARAELQRWLSS